MLGHHVQVLDSKAIHDIYFILFRVFKYMIMRLRDVGGMQAMEWVPKLRVARAPMNDLIVCMRIPALRQKQITISPAISTASSCLCW